MIRSLLLFAHIVGMLTLFVGLGLELLSLQSLRRFSTRGEASSWIRMYKALPRVYGIAFGFILLSGIFLAARVGVHQFAWVRVSFVAMLVMSVIGGPLIRSRRLAITRDDVSESLLLHASDRILRTSLRVRIALGLAIIYLMIGKAGLAHALVVMGVALLVGLAMSAYDPGPAATTDTSRPIC
jgi:hypothetical protein